MRRRFNSLAAPIKVFLIVFCTALVGTIVITSLGNVSISESTGKGFVEDLNLNSIDSDKGLLSEAQIEDKIWEINPNEVSEDNAIKILKSLTKLNKYMLMTGGDMQIGEACLKQNELTFGECVQKAFDNSPELQSKYAHTEGMMKTGLAESTKGGMQLGEIPFFQEFFSE